MTMASLQRPTTRITGPTVEIPVHFRSGNRGRRRLKRGSKPTPNPVEPGRIPRISRLMALAIHFDGLIRQGVVRDCADLARLGGVSRTRMSQVMDLLKLAPDIVENLLYLPKVTAGRDPISERVLRPIATEIDWAKQRELWHHLDGRHERVHPRLPRTP